MDQRPAKAALNWEAEVKALGELEYAAETLLRLMTAVEMNLHLNNDTETVRKALSTAHLWLRQAISEQHKRIDRRAKA